MESKVYIVEFELELEPEDIKYFSEFKKVFRNELIENEICLKDVFKDSRFTYKEPVDQKTLVIIYNGYKVDEGTDDKRIVFLRRAEEMKAMLWPVAYDCGQRKPQDVISKKQSFDIWDQLRCRNHNKALISSIAKAFARTIIAQIRPTLYDEQGEIFISHRRVDGEEIAANLFDKMRQQVKEVSPFRDVSCIKVGESAQDKIDHAMEKSMVFIFLHTERAIESDWIKKELRYAQLHNIPILWVQIDGADPDKIRWKPSDRPHLKYNSEQFCNEKELTGIVDEILENSFKLIMINSGQVLEQFEEMRTLFGEKLFEKNPDKCLYHISMERRGYSYPQRKIEQCVQVFGRKPVDKDIREFRKEIEGIQRDSAVLLSDKVVKREWHGDVIVDSFEDFFHHWNVYLNGKGEQIDMKKSEIVISGAFPDEDEIYKQSLMHALVQFSKEIMKAGYVLTFGAHPTYQEPFFEVAKEMGRDNPRSQLKMFISKWFLEKDANKENEYQEKCRLMQIPKQENREQSLSQMRKQMIQRDEVKALVCLGGKIREDKNKEGIREEITFAIEYKIPVFLVGSVGGVSSEIANEYSKKGWAELNDAPTELNEKFRTDIGYSNLAKRMIEFIE